MNIEFDNPNHEKLVNDYEALKKRYNKVKGVDSASNIIAVLDVLFAANTLADVPPGYRPHPLTGTYKGCFAVDVDKVNRVIFRPNHERDSNYRIDNYKTIKNISIIEIFKNYHKG
jgi:mRNA-degrading endonuclease YafQ of YafQ-DinJ toxin-antitoxin module